MGALNLYKHIISHPHYYYCEKTNSFNSKSYKSKQGNGYHIELRIVKGIIVKAEIGLGYKYRFINQLQFFQIQTKKLLKSIEFHNQKYNIDFIIDQSVMILSKALLSDIDFGVSPFVSKEAIPQVFQIVNSSFNTDQKSIAANINIGQLVA